MTVALEQTLQTRNMPMAEIAVSTDFGIMERRVKNDIVHSSVYTGLTVDSPEAIAASRATLPSTDDDEKFISSIMSRVDPNDDTLYLHIAYFAQFNNMTGFMYSYRNHQNLDVDIVFDTGVLLTRDRLLVDSLRYDINRPSGIGHVLKEISASVYTTMQQGAERYKNLMATSGAVGSDSIDAHAMARNALAKQQNEEIATLRAQVANLSKLVASSAELTEKLANPTSPERAAITVTPLPAAPTPVITDDVPATETAAPTGGIFNLKQN